MRVFSFGGGVQSNAALVLAAEGRIDFRVFLFANVGEDSENPDTLEYVRRISLPFADQNRIRFHVIHRETKAGETLYARTLREERSIKIPVRMKNGAPGTRSCTEDYKRAVIRRWLGTGKHIVGLGISLDEYQRARNDSGQRGIHNEYPLIDMRLTRRDCLRIIAHANLPRPPKSACWFCPFHTMTAWREMRRKNPELFQQAVELERILTEKRLRLGRDPVYLTAKGRRLCDVVADQPALFEEEACESGYCFT